MVIFHVFDYKYKQVIHFFSSGVFHCSLLNKACAASVHQHCQPSKSIFSGPTKSTRIVPEDYLNSDVNSQVGQIKPLWIQDAEL